MENNNLSSIQSNILKRKVLQDLVQTFRTEETNCIVGAVATRTLFCIEAPETHWGVCMNYLPRFSSWDPFCGSGLNSSWSLTHSGAVIEANGIQLLIVSTAARVINVEPCRPHVVIWSRTVHRNKNVLKIIVCLFFSYCNKGNNTLCAFKSNWNIKCSHGTIRVVDIWRFVVSSPWSCNRQ